MTNTSYPFEWSNFKMNEPYIAGLFGFAGILLGALIQHWCTRRASLETRFLELKSEAYADFINVVASAAYVEDIHRSAMRERLAAAKSRICVFGDGQVIEAIARLEHTSLLLSNTDAREAFLELTQIIRPHSIANGTIKTETMSTVLFGAEPSTQIARKAG
jgi:hypothetical protein